MSGQEEPDSERDVSKRYYVRFRGRLTGPLSRDVVFEQVKAGRITSLHEISTDGIGWEKMSEWRELARSVVPTAVTLPPIPSPLPPAPSVFQTSLVPVEPVNRDSVQQLDSSAPPRFQENVIGTPAEGTGMAIAGFVLSLSGSSFQLGFVLVLILAKIADESPSIVLMQLLFWASGPLALLGVVLSSIAMRRPMGRYRAIAGLVLGILATFAWLIPVWMVLTLIASIVGSRV